MRIGFNANGVHVKIHSANFFQFHDSHHVGFVLYFFQFFGTNVGWNFYKNSFANFFGFFPPMTFGFIMIVKIYFVRVIHHFAGKHCDIVDKTKIFFLLIKPYEMRNVRYHAQLCILI